MESIKIKVNHIKSTNHRLKYISSELRYIESSLSSVRNSLDSKVVQRSHIGSRLNQTLTSLNELETKVNEMNIFIDDSMEKYVQADTKAASRPFSKEKSIWAKIADGFGSVFDGAKGFVTGLADTVVSTVEGLWQVIRHPIKTAKGLVYVVKHPITAGKAIWKTIKDSWNKDVVNGDVESASHWFGRAFGEAALALVGTKGVDKAVKLSKGTKVIEEVGGVKVKYGVNSGKELTKKENIVEKSRIEQLRDKYGTFSSEELHQRINLRDAVAKEVDKLGQSNITNKQAGPALAGVLDKTTGKYYFGINNDLGYLPENLHPLIEERIMNMPPDINEGYTFTKGAGSHAEIYALNEALLANPNANIDNFLVHVVRSGKKLKPAGMAMPRCSHCKYISDGFEFTWR
ncbi:YwqJ-related putative deaminase [Neobacillus mesonae]|uniref:YwqJ-related putative deaminase n=1 Tax=Neobacillus mesonae TaxID=1193713 RepID=UPI00203FCD0F|nr:YwqJ-related putative deaminase [Neobacillus mesonae]MCM3569786.1 YwqJ-related putative deaminase [Neobacillus mesonae]